MSPLDPSPGCFPFPEFTVSVAVINRSWGMQTLRSTQGTIAPAPTHSHRELFQCRFQVIQGAWGRGLGICTLGDSETRSLNPHLEKHHLLVLWRRFHSGKCYLWSRLLQKLLSGEGRPWGRGGSSLRESTSPTSCFLALPQDSPERAPAAFPRSCLLSWLHFTMPVGGVPSLVTPWKLR